MGSWATASPGSLEILIDFLDRSVGGAAKARARARASARGSRVVWPTKIGAGNPFSNFVSTFALFFPPKSEKRERETGRVEYSTVQ